ncbi:MAG TPA: methenyltetrahydromethanopterin cyclohydrolase [Pirellulales bacterium]|nr:methenyltetrahydromethanopterin cyclohydrolase [Pirellulales bacterium]
MNLNVRSARLCHTLVADAELLRIAVHRVAGAMVIDLGIEVAGGLEAGRRLAEICMAGLGTVAFAAGAGTQAAEPLVTVATDAPVDACMASQYAGWQIKGQRFFAMGSGPMRAAAGREPLFDVIGRRERPSVAVGVLESRTLPPTDVVRDLAESCAVATEALTLLVAPTASQAGTVQVVARSVETALHKLAELQFDLERIESAWGAAPLAPVARNDLAALGRTNDAILYGGEVVLWVRGDDDRLATIGPKVPSSASRDHGRPFVEIFEQYGRDFYKVDPHLFSPAVVTFQNLDTGRVHRFGQVEPAVLRASFSD